MKIFLVEGVFQNNMEKLWFGDRITELELICLVLYGQHERDRTQYKSRRILLWKNGSAPFAIIFTRAL